MPTSWPKSLDTLYGGVRILRQAHRRNERQQVPDPGVRGGRDRARPAGARRRAERHASRWATPPRTTTSARTPPSRSARRCRSASTRRGMNAWLRFGDGQNLMNELFAKYNCIGFAAGNTGAQMGGFFRKQIKTVDDLKGLKMRIGGFAGTILTQLGVVPQQLARGRHLSGAGKGHDRRRRVGRPVRRREARLPEGRAELLLSGLVGRLRPGPQPRQPGQVERAAEDLPEHDRGRVGRRMGLGGRQVRLRQSGRAQAADRQGAQLRPFPQPVLEACYNAAQEVYAEHIEDQSDVQEAAMTA